MKLLAEDGYLRPKIQFLGGLVIAAFCLGDGLLSVMSPSIPAGRLFGTLQLIGTPAVMYYAWHGYRKMKRQGQPAASANQIGYAPPESARRRQDWVIVLCLNICIPAMLTYLRVTVPIDSATLLIVGICGLLLLNAAVLLTVRARSRRRGEVMTPKLAVGTVVLGILAALATVVGTRLVVAPVDVGKLAYSSTPLNEIRPEPRRLFVELLRRKEKNSQEYGRVAASTKPMDPALYDAASFASASAINATATELKSALDTDFAYFARQREAEQDFRERVERIDPNSEFLKEAQAQSDVEVSQNAVQKEWAASAVALYAFAARHAKDIHVSNRNLTFSDDSGPEFKKRYGASKALYKRLQEQVQASIAEQKRSRAAAGLDK
jgi:hypothetical protein